VCDAGLTVDVPPSPKSQWKTSGPTPPVVVAVKDSARLASGEAGLIVKLTPKAVATVTVWLEVAEAPPASVTVTVTTNEPDDAYVFVAGLTDAVPPSPKLQLKLYGPVPPLADAVNVTGCPASGEDGLKAKLMVRGGGGLVMVMEFLEFDVCWGDPLSLTVKTTLKVPGDE